MQFKNAQYEFKNTTIHPNCPKKIVIFFYISEGVGGANVFNYLTMKL